MLKYLIVSLLCVILYSSLTAQCNQHVFSSVGASTWTSFQYQDCEGLIHWFGLPTGGYTTILCADIGTTFILSGDGFVYPLQTEHPAYPSCIQPPCPADLDGDGEVGSQDLLLFLGDYGTLCD